MTIYIGTTFQTCALRVWGIGVSMRDFQTAAVRYNRELPTSSARSATKTLPWRSH